MISVLCTGDIHIGRAPSKLRPGDHAEELSASRTWSRIVELAIERRVDLVAVSGDLLDQESAVIEAFSVVRRGMAELARSGIRMVAISGNHDHAVFPNLARQLEGEYFRFLGRDGRWEETAFSFRDDERLSVIGWSYPKAIVDISPLAGAHELPPASGPRLGLLHADVGATNSRYCPVSEQDLRGVPLDCWLLGHVHGRRWFGKKGRGSALYPGSPMALDPGETGDHGVHILRFDDSGLFDDEFIAISPVRYDNLLVSLDASWGSLEIASHLTEACEDHCGQVNGTAAAGSLRAIVLRVEVAGRTGSMKDLSAVIGELKNQYEYRLGNCVGRIDEFRVTCQPAIDLDELVLIPGPVGELARIARACRDRDEPALAAHRDLVNTVAAEMAAIERKGAFPRVAGLLEGEGSLATAAPDTIDAIASQAMLVLEALVAQKTPPS